MISLRGVYNTVTKEYHSIQFQGAFEIVSLTGTVTRKEVTFIFISISQPVTRKAHVHGGHLEPCHHQRYCRDPGSR